MSNQVKPLSPKRSAWRNAVVEAVRSACEKGVSVERLCEILEPMDQEKIQRGVKRAAEGAEIVNIRKFQKVNGKKAFGIYVHADFVGKALMTIDGLTVAAQSAKNTSTTKPGEFAIAKPRQYDHGLAQSRYSGAELAPHQNRPAGNDFLRHPSRHGRHLVWSDGRTALIGEANINHQRKS